MSNITYSAPRVEKFEANDHGPAAGGWVNASVDILIDDMVVATADIGAHICTSGRADVGAYAYAEIRRYGYSIAAYAGDERRLSYAGEARNLADAIGLVLDTDVEDYEVESMILDEVEGEVDIDYAGVYIDALRARLAATEQDDIRDMIVAVRALDGDDE